MKAYMGIVSLVLVIMAASSLVSMISILKIDSIVHGELYNYGLTFNYHWAAPYWTMTTIVFGVGWFNILTSIAFQFYVLIYGREKATVKPEKELESTKPIEVPPQSEAKPPEIAQVTEAPETSKEQTAASTPEPTETFEKIPEETSATVEEEAPTTVTETPTETSSQEPPETEAEAEKQKPPKFQPVENQTQPEPQPTEEQVPTEPPTQETPSLPADESEQQEITETGEQTPEAQPAADVPEQQPPPATDEGDQSQQQTGAN